MEQEEEEEEDEEEEEEEEEEDDDDDAKTTEPTAPHMRDLDYKQTTELNMKYITPTIDMRACTARTVRGEAHVALKCIATANRPLSWNCV